MRIGLRAAELLACLFLGLSLGACRSHPPFTAGPLRYEPEQPELRLKSFNIRYGTAKDGPDAWEHRRQLLVDVMWAGRPEIVAVQEALRFQLDEIHAALPGIAEVGVGRDDGHTKGEYAAILYNEMRFRVREQGTFWFSDTPEIPGSKGWGNNVTRICTWALLEERVTQGYLGPPAFYVYNVHLDHQSEISRRKSAQLLVERIAARKCPECPVIITGDFNCGEQSVAIRTLVTPTPTWPGMTDTYRLLHPSETDVATFHSFKGWSVETGAHDGSTEKIDYLLIQPGAASVLAAEIDRTSRDGRYPSDHFPVTATLRWAEHRGGTTPPTQK